MSFNLGDTHGDDMALNMVAALNDKDALIDLGLYHVKQLRAGRDLARLQLKALQNVRICTQVLIILTILELCRSSPGLRL